MDLLRHLQFFVAVAGEGHFGHAADRLGMTQPPVSAGIARLERKLGVVLFSRGPRGVRLTSAGVELLPRARALLEDARRFEDDAQRYAQDRAALKIGLVPQLSDWHLAGIVARVRGLGPRAVIAGTMSSVELVDSVTAGRLDCGVVHHPALLNALECGRVLKVSRWFLLPEATRPRIRRTLRSDCCAGFRSPSRREPTARRRSICSPTYCAEKGSTRRSCQRRATARQ